MILPEAALVTPVSLSNRLKDSARLVAEHFAAGRIVFVRRCELWGHSASPLSGCTGYR
jgi:hypothetical protein